MSLIRRVAFTTSAASVRAFGTTTVSFGHMTPKVDFHKDVANTGCFVSKMAFNPYAADFMESLEKKSNAASQCPGSTSNGYQLYANTGSFIFSDSVGCKF